MVIICAPSSSPERTRQEFTGLPFKNTVHAPQSPVPQPSLVPVMPISSRSRSSSRRCVGTSRLTFFPFSVNRICLFMATSRSNWSNGFRNLIPNTPLLQHSILLISSIAPFDPCRRRSNRGVEQRAFGHGADHGASVIGGRAYVANRFRLFRRELPRSLCERLR